MGEFERFFLGLKFWPKNDFLGLMKDAGIFFWVAKKKKQRDFFRVAKKGLRDLFGYAKKSSDFLGYKI